MRGGQTFEDNEQQGRSVIFMQFGDEPSLKKWGK